MSKLENKWWFIALTTVLAGYSTRFLFQSAGYAEPDPFGRGSPLPQYAIFLLTLICLQRFYSLITWLAVLMVAPKVARGEA